MTRRFYNIVSLLGSLNSILDNYGLMINVKQKNTYNGKIVIDSSFEYSVIIDVNYLNLL